MTLVVKDVGAAGVYRNGDRDAMRAYAASGELPRVRLIEDELSDDELAALYRACDVLVHPYRGEGFAMPVLEAMACGLPVIVTGGGPTDEFCPPRRRLADPLGARGVPLRSRRRAGRPSGGPGCSSPTPSTSSSCCARRPPIRRRVASAARPAPRPRGPTAGTPSPRATRDGWRR